MKKPEAGFSYTLEDEKSTEEKLQWLEDLMEFSEAALTPKEKAVRERFRSGAFPKSGGAGKLDEPSRYV